jgi:hypothetical protein
MVLLVLVLVLRGTAAGSVVAAEQPLLSSFFVRSMINTVFPRGSSDGCKLVDT